MFACFAICVCDNLLTVVGSAIDEAQATGVFTPREFSQDLVN